LIFYPKVVNCQMKFAENSWQLVREKEEHEELTAR